MFPIVTLCVVIGIVVLYFFGVPLFIFSTHSVFAQPLVTPVDPTQGLRTETRQYFAHVHDEFSKLGFSLEGSP